MSSYDKVIWYEGMFLRPQHFQQQDRYQEALLTNRCRHLQPYDWGIFTLDLDRPALQQGKFAIRNARGILPDGTSFDMPGDDELPTPLVIDSNLRDSRILLALPERKDRGEVEREEGNSISARYRVSPRNIRDQNIGCEDQEELIKVGKRQFQLLTEQDKNFGGFSFIAVAQVIEKRSDQQVLLDEDFIPPCLDCRNWPVLMKFLEELRGLLQQNCERLASRVGVLEREGTRGIENLLMLQVLNRYQPLLVHLCRMQILHPETFYEIALQWAGELATITRSTRLPLSFPPYDHDDLKTSFKPLLDELRASVPWRRIEPAIEIPLEQYEGGKYLALIATDQRNLFGEAKFILMVKVPEKLRLDFPNKCVISAAEELMILVKKIVSGIQLKSLPVAPPYIPYSEDFAYFELDRNNEYWKRLNSSEAGLSICVTGEFPGIQMRLWALKEERQ